MNGLARMLIWPGAGAAALLCAGAAQPQPGAKQPSVAPGIAARLEALAPSDPAGYFLLAEELADTVVEEADKALPRTLYVLAFERDRARGGSLGASCALGLARIERLERDRRWLTALAGAVDRRYSLPDWNVPAGSLSEELAYKAATVLGLARSGEGPEARRLLEQPGVREVLTRYERAIGTSGETGALSRLEKYIQQWPCPECRNERTVRRVADKGVELRLCPVCRGNPGPRLSEEELTAQLRFEAALLNGIQRSWGATIVIDQGAPLRDPDPEQLAPYYGVDPARPYWRNGAWAASP
jgi:hypothetical protein